MSRLTFYHPKLKKEIEYDVYTRNLEFAKKLMKDSLYIYVGSEEINKIKYYYFRINE